MVFQAGYGQTVVNHIQLSNSLFQMDYQNQKATIKPNEIFMWCSEQGKFRVRVDISHLACCLTTFHKPTLTFRKWKWKWQKYHSEEPQSKKRNRCSFEGRHLNGDTRKSRLPDILVINFGGGTGFRFQQVSGLGESSLCWGGEGEEDIKTKV